MVALWRCAKDDYGPVLDEATTNSKQLFEVESETWGVSHAELTSELLKNWGLPESLCDAIAAHHNTDTETLSDKAATLAKVIQAASLVLQR